jgi:shikimate dehydrogenase
MHNAAFGELGMDAIYLAFDVVPERLLEVLPAMAAMGFVGVNLTIPHKEVAFNGLDELDESARLLGAVNTVRFDGGLKGFNTDGYGFLKALDEAFGRNVTDAAVVVVGTGGAGRAVALVCAREGASSVTLADVDAGRCRKVADEVRASNPAVKVNVIPELAKGQDAVREADLVVHATPVGMKEGEAAVVGPEAFRPGQSVFDLIYNLPETPVTRAALAAGASASNGLGMLLHQGAKAFQIWTGQEPPVATMRSVLEKAVYGT